MLGTRKDIIGDLARLRHDIGMNSRDPDAADRYQDLELLAAVAVCLGMSHNVANKASGVPIDRINALLSNYRPQLEELADVQGYQRHPSGVVARNS